SRPLIFSQRLRGLTYEFGSLSKFLFPLCKKVFRYLYWGSKVKRVRIAASNVTFYYFILFPDGTLNVQTGEFYIC
ncbi:MAG: hypothetical protein ACK55I_50595, partial [bacterium]